jgi:hypothetical protein
MKQQVNIYLLISGFIILLFPLLSSNFLPNILAQPKTVENIKEYDSSVFGLSIDYPSTWLIDEFEKNIKNDETVGINNIVKFCPNPATLKSTPSNINTTVLCNNPEKSFDLYVHNLPTGMTLEEFTNSKISSYKLQLTDFKIIESNPNVTIDDKPAYKLTYTYTDKINDKKIQVMEVWTVIDDDDSDDHADKAYSLRYEAIPIEFPIYLNMANNTINSFEFKNIDSDE